MSKFKKVVPLGVALLATGCASMPTGPSVMALPGYGQSFDQFRYDDADCRQYALAQIGGTSPNQSSVASGVASAAVGTALGAAAGAALSGGSGGAAAAGAGVGLLAGSMVGASSASSSRYANQQYYDHAYVQCMYAKGHQVPVAGQIMPAPHPIPATQPSTNVPPPPAGSPPPPPAGALPPSSGLTPPTGSAPYSYPGSTLPPPQ